MAGLCWNRLGRVGVGRNGVRILHTPGPLRVICASLVANRRYFSRPSLPFPSPSVPYLPRPCQPGPRRPQTAGMDRAGSK